MMINETITTELKVNNLPSYPLERYTVFRLVECGLWFYGTYETEDRADEVARELGNALVVESED